MNPVSNNVNASVSSPSQLHTISSQIDATINNLSIHPDNGPVQDNRLQNDLRGRNIHLLNNYQSETETLNKTFELLAESERKLSLDDRYKEIVLVLGNTGAGKSTFTQYITGNDSNLCSKKLKGGKFSIEDKSDTAKNSTIHSQTIFPELIVDNSTTDIRSATAYYDCPGFEDTRGVSQEIASAYCIKRLIDHSERIKLMLVVNHSSLEEGNYRNDFITLAQHIGNLVKDLGRFKGSITLIATKVDNIIVEREKGYGLIPDQEVIEGITEFLCNVVKEEAKSELKKSNLTDDDRRRYTAAIQLIDALVVNAASPKIGLFRRPDKAGSLSEIALFRKAKPQLQQFIESTQFLPSASEYFGYTISDKYKHHVQILAQTINDTIASDAAKLGEMLQRYFQDQVKQSKDCRQLIAQLSESYNSLKALKESLTEINSPKEFVNTFRNQMANCKLPIDGIQEEKRINTLLKQADYLEFLQTVSNTELTTTPDRWSNQLLGKVNSDLEHFMQWYEFLFALQNKLSAWAVQHNPSRYNVADIQDWGQVDKGQGIHIDSDNIRPFLAKVQSDFSINVKETIHRILESSERLEELNRLLKLELSLIEVKEEGEKLTVKGRYVKLSEVERALSAANTKPTWLEIFGLDTVFIDTNLTNERLKGTNVIIAAPAWEVIGGHCICLDGAAASQIVPDKVETGLYDGAAGQPGKPGGTGGSLLGVGNYFRNAEDLTITAHGGKGGPGQDGGDGGNGQKGKDAVFPETTGRATPEGAMQIDRTVTDGPYHASTVYTYYYCIHNGKAGGPGRPGGAGGQRGQGGKPGTLKLINLMDNSTMQEKIHQESAAGEAGKGGRGKGGEGGHYIDHATAKLEIEHYGRGTGAVPDKIEWTLDPKKAPKHIRNGRNGVDNSNGAGRDGKPAEPLPMEDFYPHLNAYKHYLRANLVDPLYKTPLTTFLDQIEKAHRLNELSTPLGLVNEFQGLEEQFYTMSQQVDLRPRYQSFLDRVRDHAKDSLARAPSLLLDDKKALSYLYTAALSKLNSLNVKLDPHLVIDMKGYLDLVEATVKELNTQRKREAISNYQEKYTSSIEQQIKDAQGFVKAEIEPAIEKMGTELDQQLEALITETVEQQAAEQENQENQQALQAQQRKLEEALTLRALFGVLKLGSTVIGCVGGPVGVAVGAVIGTGTMVAESLVLDDKTVGATLLSFPSEVSKGLNAFQAELKKREKNQLKVIEQQLAQINRDFEGFSTEVGDITQIVTNIQAKVTTEPGEPDPNGLAELYGLQKQLETELSRKKTDLESRESAPQTKTLLAHVERATKTVQIIAMISASVAGIYEQYQQGQEKQKVIETAIQKSKDQLTKLKQYEDNIYKDIIPGVARMRQDIQAIERGLASQSKVSLDVTQWRVQIILKDMQFQLKQITQGFKVQGALARCFEKLDEGMTTLIHLYSRIQACQDQQKLADYIAQINSPVSTGITIVKEDLRLAVESLELAINANLLLVQYECARKSFEQWAFPFTQTYLPGLDLPTEFNMDSLQGRVQETIRNIRTRLIEYRTSINEYDNQIMTEDFDSEGEFTAPFAVWKPADYWLEIKNLLSGEPVTFKADVAFSAPWKDAIKFSEIAIRMKWVSSDDVYVEEEQRKQNQKSLDKVLNLFSVDMTHWGNSYYRYDNQYSSIPGEKLLINYSFERRGSPLQPVSSNGTYKKLSRGDFMLSPYTFWTMQLISQKEGGQRQAEYNQLKSYVGKVDLELVGKGWYIKTRVDSNVFGVG
ncbi:hypothetical protein KMZ15_01320 [Mycoavidus sp. HKI]|uniref:hypothetical protein n=1 Tax=Mycoavidus sp. HKI TaxID=2840467 RepID=UPI001CC083FF|nr:hypothetical protein [Mycoavidus sp. HKI]UAW64364.1 hypothetical protein KMZ15_01320 [Mycoavidus sp. HKI]